MRLGFIQIKGHLLVSVRLISGLMDLCARIARLLFLIVQFVQTRALALHVDKVIC